MKSPRTILAAVLTTAALSTVLAATDAAVAPTPAEAFPNVRVCIGAPLTPKPHPRGILCEGKTRCVGWTTGNRIETKVWCEERFGIDSNGKWVLAERRSSGFGVGGNSGYWITRYTPRDQRMRTCTSAEVVGNNGLVVKRYGKTCSGARTL